jgi:hypothetical protein
MVTPMSNSIGSSKELGNHTVERFSRKLTTVAMRW